MVTNQPTKTMPPRLIRLLIASSLILGLVSLRVNADEQSVRADLKSEAQALVSTPPSANFAGAAAGGVLLPLALLYLSRRRRIDEPSVLDEVGGSAASGGEYPRIYPVTTAWKTGICLLFGILLLGSLAGAWGFGVIAAESRDAPQGLILALLFAALASAMVFYIIDTLKSAIVLKPDRLEVHELWRVRRVLRSNIETQQVLHPPNSPAMLVLRLKAPGNGKIKLPVMWHTDSTWRTWFAVIPDIDAEAAKAFEAEIDANTELGTTPAERQQKLGTARSVTRIATWANTGLIAWAYIYPHPYELVIFVLAALPWVAVCIMARSPGVYVLNAPRGSGRPDLTVLLISPGFLLMLRAPQDVHILDWQRLLLLAVLVAMALMGSVVWAIPSARQRLGTVALTLALLMAYGYGAAALGNAVLDQTKGSTYPTTVYGKHVTGGRNRTPTMQLGPWGPRATQEEATVPWDLYRSTTVGEKVCVLLHPGAFGVPWYRIARCQPAQEAV